MNKKSIFKKHLLNNKSIFIQGMRLTNANGAIDPNTAGFDFVTRTTSYLRSRIIRQKFYEVAISDYMPVDVGEAAWKSEIIQNIVYDKAGSFFEGDIDTMVGNGKIAEVNAALAPIKMPTVLWAKGVSWNVSEVAQAGASSNWDPIEGKMGSLKKNWDLGIQEVAFLGHPVHTAITGLLNNAEVTINTTIITENLSNMTETEFTAFVRTVLAVYYANSGYTVLPDTFVMPMSDFLGMGVPFSSTYPVVVKLDYLLNMFRKMTGNPNFSILGLAYSDAAQNASRGINKNRYALYRRNPEVLSLSIPVDFNMFEAETANSIFWQQPAVGQYSGVLVPRPGEMLYFDDTAPFT